MKYTFRQAILLVAFFCVMAMARPVYAATPFTDAYVTLSNSRFSFRAQLSGAHGSGITIVAISTAGSSTFDEDVNNLFPGDVVCFNSSALAGCQGQTTYTVNNAIASATVGITPALAAGLLSSDQMTSTQSGTMTVTFKPATAVPSGAKLVLTIPAATSANGDGFPDAAGWDDANLPADLVSGTGCSGSACFAPTSFTASAAALSNAGAGVHTVTITLSSVLTAGSTYSFRLGHTSDPKLRFLNPLPSGTSHTRGLADTYSIRLISQDSGQTVTYDDTIMKVAPQDGVFVSANVEESITYQINDTGNGYGGNIASSTNVTQCNGGSFTTGVATSPYAVPFGSVLNMETFCRAAQSHYVVTNAADGFTLTVLSDGPLSTLGGGNTIANGSCDGACTTTSSGAWTTASNNGFAYTLGNITGSEAAFTSNFRIFDNSLARTVMSKASPTNASRTAMCYQLSVDATQTTGYYFNKLYYVATPLF